MKKKENLLLDLTGNALLLFETTGGPIEFKIREIDVVLKILNVLLEENTSWAVDAYSDEEKEQMTMLLNGVHVLSPGEPPTDG
jgi:hypothetical protein